MRYFILCFLFTIFAVSPVLAAEKATDQQPVDKSIVDHYTHRTIISAQPADPTLQMTGSLRHIIILDDGSVWWTKVNVRSEFDLRSLVGRTIDIQYHSGRPADRYYEFVSSDNPTKVLAGGAGVNMQSSHLALRVAAVEMLNYEKVNEESNMLRRLGASEGEFRTTAAVTLSDGSKWTISSYNKNFDAAMAGQPPTVVGASVQIVWLKDSDKGLQPAMIEQRPPVVRRVLMIDSAN